MLVAGERGGQKFDEVLSAPRPVRVAAMPAPPTTPRGTSPGPAAAADEQSSLPAHGAGGVGACASSAASLSPQGFAPRRSTALSAAVRPPRAPGSSTSVLNLPSGRTTAPPRGPSDASRLSPTPAGATRRGRRGARSSTTRRGRCGSRTPTRRTPGRRDYYPEQAEVDHQALVERLVAEFEDGWALSHERRGAAAGPRAVPGRGAGVLVAARGAPHPVAAADQRVGAADRSRRPGAAARRAADRPRRARLRRSLPRVPGRDHRDEAAAVRGVDVPPARRSSRR